MTLNGPYHTKNKSVELPLSKSEQVRYIIAASLAGKEIDNEIITNEDAASAMKAGRHLDIMLNNPSDPEPVETRFIASTTPSNLHPVETRFIASKPDDDDFKQMSDTFEVSDISTNTIDCGESGITLNIAAFIAGVSGKDTRLIKRKTLADRNIDPLLNSLKSAGINPNNEIPGELLIPAGNIKDKIELDCSKSTQPLTGLLFAAPLKNTDTTIVVKNLNDAAGYIDITLGVLKHFGIKIFVETGSASSNPTNSVETRFNASPTPSIPQPVETRFNATPIPSDSPLKGGEPENANDVETGHVPSNPKSIETRFIASNHADKIFSKQISDTFEVSDISYIFNIPGNQKYTVPENEFQFSYDASGMPVWAAIAALSGRMSFADKPAALGTQSRIDRFITVALRDNARFSFSTTGRIISVESLVKLVPIDVDASGFPDTIPALAAFACSIPGVSQIKGIKRLTYKESNRAEAIKKEFGKTGAEIELDYENDIMTISGGQLRNSRINSHSDHRIAMAAAILPTIFDISIEIKNPECVAKTYPGFWDELDEVVTPLTPSQNL
jgi:5-enolpyruvylshikimate-3-phosphate synthase